MATKTRNRAIGILAVTLVAYALSLILIGSAGGFDHGAMKWLIAGGLSAVALGMLGSAALRVAVLILDPRGRELWWAERSTSGRILRAGSLAIRFLMAILVWGLAVSALR